MKPVQDFIVTIFDKKMLFKVLDYRFESGKLQLLGELAEIVETPKEEPIFKLKEEELEIEDLGNGVKGVKVLTDISGHISPVNTYPDYTDDTYINKDIELDINT